MRRLLFFFLFSHNKVQRLDPKIPFYQDTRLAVGMRPEETWVRDELAQAKQAFLLASILLLVPTMARAE